MPSLIPLLIYKALKPGSPCQRQASSLIPLLIYKALKPDRDIAGVVGSLIPLLIYKALKLKVVQQLVLGRLIPLLIYKALKLVTTAGLPYEPFDSLTDLQSSQTSNYVLTELCCQLYFIIKHLSLSIIYVFSPSKLLCSRFSINKSCNLQ